MDLQTRYRLERDKISVHQTEDYYFAYQMTDTEFHFLELYIPPEKRGNIQEHFENIYQWVEKTYPLMEYAIACITPKTAYGEKVENCEKMLSALLKEGFQLLSAEENKITLCLILRK